MEAIISQNPSFFCNPLIQNGLFPETLGEYGGVNWLSVNVGEKYLIQQFLKIHFYQKPAHSALKRKHEHLSLYDFKGVIIFPQHGRRTHLLRISPLNQKHLPYPHFTNVFEDFLSVYRIDRFLGITLYRAVNGVVNKAVNICIHLLTRYLTTVYTIFQNRSVCKHFIGVLLLDNVLNQYRYQIMRNAE